MLCVRVDKCVMGTGLCYVVCPCRQVCDEYWFGCRHRAETVQVTEHHLLRPHTTLPSHSLPTLREIRQAGSSHLSFSHLCIPTSDDNLRACLKIHHIITAMTYFYVQILHILILFSKLLMLVKKSLNF